MLTMYLGHVDFVLNDQKVRAWRIPLDYEAAADEVVFFSLAGCRFKVTIDGLNTGRVSLQMLAGLDGSIDTALPQSVFNDLLNQGQQPRDYVWYYGPNSRIFGELLAKQVLCDAAETNLQRLIGFNLVECSDLYKERLC